MKSLLLSLIVLFTSNSAYASAADDGLAFIAEISARENPTSRDLETLSLMFYDDLYLQVGNSENEVFVACRLAIAGIVNKSPLVFFEYVSKNLRSLRLYPFVVAHLVTASLDEPSSIVSVLNSFDLINPEVIDYLLAPKRGNISLSNSNQRLRIALKLRDNNLYSEAMNEILLEAIHVDTLSDNLRIHAIQKLVLTDRIAGHATLALQFIALSASASVPLRSAAVNAIASEPTQRSVDALWEIAGMTQLRPRKASPNLDTAAVVQLAKNERRRLLQSGNFQERRLTERAVRALRCGPLLSTPK